MSLRTKLLLLSLGVLVLPWAGWQFVREMETLLRQGQEQALLASAEALARGVAVRPGLPTTVCSRSTKLARTLVKPLSDIERV